MPAHTRRHGQAWWCQLLLHCQRTDFPCHIGVLMRSHVRRSSGAASTQSCGYGSDLAGYHAAPYRALFDAKAISAFHICHGTFSDGQPGVYWDFSMWYINAHLCIPRTRSSITATLSGDIPNNSSPMTFFQNLVSVLGLRYTTGVV